jgi:hypothetical protein
MNRLPTLGLVLQDTPTTTMNTLVIGCQKGMAASRLPRWRSMFKDATIRSIGDQQIRNKAIFVAMIASLRQRRTPQVHIILARHKVPELHRSTPGIPQLHYDQRNSVARSRGTAKHKETKIILIMSLAGMIALTRSQLKKLSDYQTWRHAEWAQQSKYRTQNMFGAPV